MHAYATDLRERSRALLALVFMSGILAWALSELLRGFSLSPPWWLEIPSVVGFLGMLSAVMEKYAWRWRISRLMALSTTANLAGEWEGTVRSSHDGFSEARLLKVRIHQTWSTIRIETTGSHSASLSYAAMLSAGSEGARLTYLYNNRPMPAAPRSMQAHDGCAELVVEGIDHLRGVYFSGRGRGNHGEINVRRTA